MDHLPSLNSIRIFEAVARLGSYTAAAEELGVTTSAVSHRIKALEKKLNVILVNSEKRRAILTATGQQYYEQIVPGLTSLNQATTALRHAKGERILRISATANLAGRWLLPRLDSFMAAFPEVRIELSATANVVEFTKGPIDIGIRYLPDIPSGLLGASLGPNHVFPICSPKLVKGPPALRKPEDLKHHVLLDSLRFPAIDADITSWKDWFRRAGLNGIAGKETRILSPRWLMTMAVVQGRGVAINWALSSADDLSSKRLVIPFGPALPNKVKFFALYPESSARNPDIVAFLDWITAEAQTTLKSMKLPVAKESV